MMHRDIPEKKKHETDAGQILNQLGELFSYTGTQVTDPSACFDYPLAIIQKTMNFDASVLYRVTNVVNGTLMLEVVKLSDPGGFRKDLAGRHRLGLSLEQPGSAYVNEVGAFKSKRVSAANIPGAGCDIMGYVYVPEEFGCSYLFGGDFFGRESAIREQDIAAFEIMCNYLSILLIKTGYEHEAIHDHLTGLLNSSRIKLEVEKLLKRLSRHPGDACVVMADIDHFKQINDRYGHLQGDMVLKKVAEILSTSMRQYIDTVGRYGGEEFMIILEDTDAQTAVTIIERIRKEIEQTRFSRIDEAGKKDGTRFLTLTVSFGISSLAGFGPDLPEPGEWINRADKALYAAKKKGRNQTQVFSTDRNTGESDKKLNG